MKTMTQTVSRPGYTQGLETLDAEVELDSLPVEGSIPEWLTGMPAAYRAGTLRGRRAAAQPLVRRLRDAASLLASVVVVSPTPIASSDGKAYRGGRARRRDLATAEFATDPCRSIFRRAATLFRPKITDNCNVNLIRLGEEYVAMTETPLPVAFDPETLATLGVASTAARASTPPPIRTTTRSVASCSAT